MDGFKNYICKILFLIFLYANITGLHTPVKVYAETYWTKITSINSDYINVLESTPKGLLVGEYDGRAMLDPPAHNGVFFSPDFGENWEKMGLSGRGVLDLKYYEGNIYATTYYTVDNSRGSFMSKDFGITWENIGPNLSPTKIDRDSKTIYLGTRNYGVYISKDEGLSWEKLWEGSGTPLRVCEIQSSEEITLASTLTKVYRTLDKGETWNEIDALEGLTIGSICINGDIIFAGATSTEGMYVSYDRGDTWNKVLGFGNYSVDKIIYFEGVYYAGRYNPETGKYSVFSSSDQGMTWADTGLNLAPLDKVRSLAVLFSKPSYLFSAVTTKGLHRYQIPVREPSNFPFLSVPWQTQNENELVDKITSYFDHSYPLLGYSYYSEPEDENSSTLNFLGYKDSEPYIYYSSHSGTDFGLKYGTEILAPAPGHATYYYCKDCGNSIKIDHQNGYQTTYMHLQDEDIITKSDKIWVNNSDIIGKVGLTGRTTGPHLHFEVSKDREMDGTFSNDFPMGRTDPFGWLDTNSKDPWEIFTWNDSLGTHSGTSSSYLWNIGNKEGTQTIQPSSNPDEHLLTLDNKNVEFEDPQELFTVKIVQYVQPYYSNAANAVSYIKNTSFLLEVFNQVGKTIESFDKPINISVDISPEDLQNIITESISLYFWDEASKIWEKIPTIFHEQTAKLDSSTNHLSWFAVFGEKEDSQPPETQIILSGSQEDRWFTENPLVELITDDGGVTDLEFTVYSMDEGDFWHNYTQPFYIEQNGIMNLIYKSQDSNGNMESENNFVIHVNTQGLKTQRIRIKNTGFEIN